MKVVDALRRAEQRGKQSAQRGAQRAKAGMHELEDRIRVTLHHGAQAMSAHIDPRQEQVNTSAPCKTGIVSINGQDVERYQCTGGRRPA